MKKSLMFACVLMFALKVVSQQVKKVQIAEIEDIIQKTDHPVIISFWATWCIPCLHEIPYFQETVKKYADQKVELVLVSLDFKESYPAALETFVKRRNFKASLYWLNETNADLFCAKIDSKWNGSIPATLFINNKTNYRKFFDRQLTPLQVEAEVKAQVKE
ncbi:MAG: redoxin domain-containing protein [Chitinophagaceae bacterium]|nr:redoxin domain-containing protein [Chitinophagaceae bacterium]